MPHDPTPQPESIIVIRLPRAEKGRYVAASRAAGQTLADWCRATLTAAAPPIDAPAEKKAPRQ